MLDNGAPPACLSRRDSPQNSTFGPMISVPNSSLFVLKRLFLQTQECRRDISYIQADYRIRPFRRLRLRSIYIDNASFGDHR